MMTTLVTARLLKRVGRLSLTKVVGKESARRMIHAKKMHEFSTRQKTKSKRDFKVR